MISNNCLLIFNLLICSTIYGEQDFWCWIKKDLDSKQATKTFSPIHSFDRVISELTGSKRLEFNFAESSSLKFEPFIDFNEDLMINFVLKPIEPNLDYRNYFKSFYSAPKSFFSANRLLLKPVF